ncbi:MAG: methylated-DNA--[protein]-cysteine S-methyltransferase [Rickettsiales bacterium]|nr:methylated-DNA--[protein]-cysteine S-methyltransferase [Rickettsiales bacterium]
MSYSTHYKSPIGEILLASDGRNLTGLWMAGQKYFAATAANAVRKDDLAIFDQTRRWLDRYFAGDKPKISELPLAPRGTDFRQSVWKILCEIPYGEVTTYGDIARRLRCTSARAVGGAVGHNPISIIIPCHRVIGTDGGLTGYAGGLDRKVKLLELERA